MNKLTRSNGLKIAAVIILVLGLIGMIVYDVPDLARGMDAVNQASNANQGPPYFVVVIGFAVDVLAVVAAYGVWRAERWGVILAIIISAINSLNGAGAAIFAPDISTRIAGAVGVILSLGVIYLCLRREPKSLTQSV